jgi:hypothetical protein
VHEVLARLPELRQIGDHRLVRLHEVAVASPPAARPCEARRLILLRRQRDGDVGADAGERIERLTLRAVEPVGEAHDRNHERDPDAEAEQRHDRAPTTAQELVPNVCRVEHQHQQDQTGLRAS